VRDVAEAQERTACCRIALSAQAVPLWRWWHAAGHHGLPASISTYPCGYLFCPSCQKNRWRRRAALYQRRIILCCNIFPATALELDLPGHFRCEHEEFRCLRVRAISSLLPGIYLCFQGRSRRISPVRFSSAGTLLLYSGRLPIRVGTRDFFHHFLLGAVLANRRVSLPGEHPLNACQPATKQGGSCHVSCVNGGRTSGLPCCYQHCAAAEWLREGCTLRWLPRTRLVFLLRIKAAAFFLPLVTARRRKSVRREGAVWRGRLPGDAALVAHGSGGRGGRKRAAGRRGGSGIALLHYLKAANRQAGSIFFGNKMFLCAIIASGLCRPLSLSRLSLDGHGLVQACMGKPGLPTYLLRLPTFLRQGVP